ncbi:sugar ABC transporter substrate-binding protein [Microbacterium horticulturae]|uniref:Sugar ABC transporter substrate-binding protein n=1 Tax=Microbacterium horticulturae TaxID=3028316 RepID=A0ABY8BX87_9MICO|nr:sugar ABC transporter substrate-binding protein [Microbacterium sp. KACC 23027]WEG08774.1 sugar ABC transporter substrate-binding protein [Microbacterium sp. KACC 23027]
MKKTIVATTSVALVAALGLTGCSSSGGDAGDSGPVTITYSNFISNGGNEDNLKKIVAAFEDENPNITVKVTTAPYSDYFTQLQTDLAAGTQADVFDVDAGSFANIQANGVLAALDGVDASAYRTSVLDSYKVDGAQYALPTSFSNVVLFYNKDLFDKAGVDYPTADWTWADEKAAAEKLTDKKAGVWGDYQPVTYNEYYKAVQQAGGSFLSSDGKTTAFDSEAGKAAAEWIAGKSGTVMPTAADGAGTADFDTNLFKDGKLAMWHTGIWMISLVGDLPFGWDIAVEPGDAQKASATFSNAVVVSDASNHKEAAQKWAEYLSSSKEMVGVRLDAGWELPAISDESLLQPYLEQTPPANRKAVFDALENIAVAPQLGSQSQQIQDAVTNALGEIAAGRTTTEKAIPALADQVDALLQ